MVFCIIVSYVLGTLCLIDGLHVTALPPCWGYMAEYFIVLIVGSCRRGWVGGWVALFTLSREIDFLLRIVVDQLRQTVHHISVATAYH